MRSAKIDLLESLIHSKINNNYLFIKNWLRGCTSQPQPASISELGKCGKWQCRPSANDSGNTQLLIQSVSGFVEIMKIHFLSLHAWIFLMLILHYHVSISCRFLYETSQKSIVMMQMHGLSSRHLHFLRQYSCHHQTTSKIDPQFILC